MSWSNPLIINNLPNYTEKIGHLVCMMNYARLTTLNTIKNLSIQELDFQLDEKSNSIGALLSHIVSVETYYQAKTFENRALNDDEEKIWKNSLELGELGKSIKDNSLEHYLQILEITRNKTLVKLQTLSDDWLFLEHSIGSTNANNYWFWFHVVEDEINHRGQIRMIKKRAIQNSNRN